MQILLLGAGVVEENLLIYLLVDLLVLVNKGLLVDLKFMVVIVK